MTIGQRIRDAVPPPADVGAPGQIAAAEARTLIAKSLAMIDALADLLDQLEREGMVVSVNYDVDHGRPISIKIALPNPEG